MRNDALDRTISNPSRAKLLFRTKELLSIGSLVSASNGRSSCPQVPDLWPECRDQRGQGLWTSWRVWARARAAHEDGSSSRIRPIEAFGDCSHTAVVLCIGSTFHSISVRSGAGNRFHCHPRHFRIHRPSFAFRGDRSALTEGSQDVPEDKSPPNQDTQPVPSANYCPAGGF